MEEKVILTFDTRSKIALFSHILYNLLWVHGIVFFYFLSNGFLVMWYDIFCHICEKKWIHQQKIQSLNEWKPHFFTNMLYLAKFYLFR